MHMCVLTVSIHMCLETVFIHIRVQTDFIHMQVLSFHTYICVCVMRLSIHVCASFCRRLYVPYDLYTPLYKVTAATIKWWLDLHLPTMCVLYMSITICVF